MKTGTLPLQYEFISDLEQCARQCGKWKKNREENGIRLIKIYQTERTGIM